MQIWSVEIKKLESLYSSIKGQYLDLEKELVQLLKFDDANVILIYSRRCLEVIINDLCESELKRSRKTEPLKGIIDKLGHEEKVPSHIIASMEGLNSLSTFGAHPKDFDPEQLKPVLSNLAIIIKWYVKFKEEKEKAKDEVEEGYRVQEEKLQVTRYKLQGAGERVQVTGDGVKGNGKKPFYVFSGILAVAVIAYIILDQFNVFKKDKFEAIRDQSGKISIAVMPFENQTGDTTLNWFQRGISSLIINGLGNSPELAVLDDQTMFEAMEGINEVYTAGISPAVARDVAKKVKAVTYISGSFQGREDTYWVLVNLVNTESGEIIWTNKMAGNLKSSGYLDLADSLCNEIKNHLEIKALENVADYEFRDVYPKSAEAYRYFIEGMNSVLNMNYESGIQSLKKALEIDSTFTFASFYIAYAYCYINNMQQAILWTKKAYPYKDRIPAKYQLWVDMWNSCYYGKSVKEVGHYCDLLAESGINTRLFWSDLAVTYCDFSHEYEKAIQAFEKVLAINQERGTDWKFHLFYERFLIALHITGNHEREKEISGIALNVVPDYSNWILYRMAVCALSQGKMKEADEIIARYKAKHKESGTLEHSMEANFGQMYMEANIMDQAEMHYRKAYELSGSENNFYKFFLAGFLINNDINLDEGMELIEELLAASPGDIYFLKSKGRGLYKQGKYEDAVQLLREVQEKWSGADYELSVYLPEAEQALANQKR